MSIAKAYKTCQKHCVFYVSCFRFDTHLRLLRSDYKCSRQGVQWRDTFE